MFWALKGTVFDLSIIVSVLLIAFFAFIITAVLRTAAKRSASPSQSGELVELLRESRQRISRLGFLSNKVSDDELSKRISAISRIASDILQTLNRKPDLVNGVRFFLNYYLPVLTKLIEDYDNLAERGVSDSAVRDTKASLDALVQDAENAFQKQLDAMADDMLIDIGAEIKVFSRSLRDDGLIEDGVQVESGVLADEDRTIDDVGLIDDGVPTNIGVKPESAVLRDG